MKKIMIPPFQRLVPAMGKRDWLLNARRRDQAMGKECGAALTSVAAAAEERLDAVSKDVEAAAAVLAAGCEATCEATAELGAAPAPAAARLSETAP